MRLNTCLPLRLPAEAMALPHLQYFPDLPISASPESQGDEVHRKHQHICALSI
jgi:hypothetical protein